MTRAAAGVAVTAATPAATLPMLYSLSFDCPFAWPAKPSYLTKEGGRDASMHAVNGAQHHRQHNGSLRTGSSDSDDDVHDEVEVEYQEGEQYRPQQLKQQDDHAEQETDIQASAATAVVDGSSWSSSWPATLRELYLDCLYGRGRSGGATTAPAVDGVRTHALSPKRARPWSLAGY